MLRLEFNETITVPSAPELVNSGDRSEVQLEDSHNEDLQQDEVSLSLSEDHLHVKYDHNMVNCYRCGTKP